MRKAVVVSIVFLFLLAPPLIQSEHDDIPNSEIQSVETLDRNEDGFFDGYRITFKNSTAADRVHPNEFFVAHEFVSGRWIPGIDKSPKAGTSMTFEIFFPSWFTPDTSITPALEYRRAGRPVFQATEADGIQPLILSVDKSPSNANVGIVHFSEPVTRFESDENVCDDPTNLATLKRHFRYEGDTLGSVGGPDGTVEFINGNKGVKITLTSGGPWAADATVDIIPELNPGTETCRLEDAVGNRFLALADNAKDTALPVIDAVLGRHGSNFARIRFTTPVQNAGGTAVTAENLTLSGDPAISISSVQPCLDCSVLRVQFGGASSGNLNYTQLGSISIDVEGSEVVATEGNAVAAGAPETVVDSEAPTVETIEALKTTVDGIASKVRVTFSEPITRTGALNSTAANWTLSNWGASTMTVTGITSHADGGWTVIDITRSGTPGPVVDGSSAPIENITYTGGGADLTDIEGTPLADFFHFSARDLVRPSLIGAETKDWDEDGIVDGYRLTFSERVDNSSKDLNDWTVAGRTIDSLHFAPGEKVAYLNFSEAGAPDTAIKPRLTTAAGAIADFSGNDLLAADTNANKPKPTDTAAPVFVGAVGGVGQTQVTLTFSEPVNTTGAGSGLTTTDFDYHNNNNNGTGDIVSGSSSHSNGQATFTVTVTPGIIESDHNNDTVELFGGEAEGTADGLPVKAKEVFLSGSDDRFQLDSATTDDTDGNGFIDRLRLTFDSSIRDDTFDTTEWEVVGYTIAQKENDNFNNRYMNLTLQEKTGTNWDTGATPTVKYPRAGEDPTLVNTNNVALANVDRASTDKARPVAVRAETAPGSQSITYRFSEGVREDGSNGPLDDANLQYNDETTHRVSMTSATQGAACQATVEITLNTTLSQADMGADSVQPKSSVEDCVDNAARLTAKFLEDVQAPEIDRVETDNWASTAKVPRLKVFFNEGLNQSTVNQTAAIQDDDWIVVLEPGDDPLTVAQFSIENTTGGNFLYINISSVAPTLTNATPTVQYMPDGDTGEEIKDLEGNPLLQSSVFTAIDKVKPVLHEARTRDNNPANGHIDRYIMTYSEAMDLGSFSRSQWDAGNYDIATSNSFTGQVEANIITMALVEKTSFDTGFIPDLSYGQPPDGATAKDANGNFLAPISLTGNAAGNGTEDTGLFDGARPRVIGVDTPVDGTSKRTTITFSEKVQKETGGVLTTEQFNYTDVNDEGAEHLDSVANVSDDKVYELRYDFPVIQSDLTTDTFRPLDTIVDLAAAANRNNQGPITLGGEEQDIDPPARITTFTATATSPTTVSLAWTAPGDQDMDHYLIRYNTTAAITEASWDSSFPVNGTIPDPVPNASQNMTVVNLTTDVTYFFAIRTVDINTLISDVSVSASATPEVPDTTDPGAITNLVHEAETIGADRVTLQWTAPGDDGSTGGAVAGYEIRYATSSFSDSESAFDAATLASSSNVVFIVGETANQIASPGQTQTATVSGLTRDTTYFMRIRAVDEVPNEGPISQSVTFTTLNDTTPPTGSLSFTSGTHGTPSTATTGSFAWSGVTDPESTVRYHYIRDTTATTDVTSAAASTTETTLTLQNLPVGINHLHVKAISAGGATQTFHFQFEVVATLTDDAMAAADALLVYTVTRTNGQNVINWTLPGADSLPEQVTAIQIWRSDSPYQLVETVTRGSDAFGASRYTDTDANATADSVYFLTMVFRGGQSAFSGVGTDVPNTDDFPGTPPTEETQQDGGDGTDGGADDEGLPLWVWILIIAIAVPFVIGVIVAIVVAARRGREEDDIVTAERDDGGYVWPEEHEQEEAQAAPEGPAHHLECPNCKHRFTAYGEKPLTTTCPNCSKRGTLR